MFIEVSRAVKSSFQITRGSRHGYQLGWLHPLLIRIGNIKKRSGEHRDFRDDLYVSYATRFLRDTRTETICKCGAM